MGSEGYTLHILFFPFMAQGHMIPMIDMAKLFAAHGVKATILTTPANAPLIQPFLDRAIVFHGVNFFSLCVFDSFDRYKPLENLPDEAESLTVPGLPHDVKLLKSQNSDFQRPDSSKAEFFKKVRESDYRSYGVVVNSFYELEPEYVRHYRKVIGRKAWHIGPVALCNTDIVDKSKRLGIDTSIDSHTFLNLLDTKNPGSVIYVCFGSLSEFSPAQLREIALGLEERGVVIKGWTPQILILNHPSVGGFLTHCGWNSSLEGISAGLPLVTWPIFAEQFYNEKLIVEVLRIGVAAGVKEFAAKPEEREILEAAEVERAVRELMDGGEEAEERRRRARELGEAARRAVEKGGSSYVDMGNLIHELMNREKNSVEKQSIDVCNVVATAPAA